MFKEPLFTTGKIEGHQLDMFAENNYMESIPKPKQFPQNLRKQSAHTISRNDNAKTKLK